jgi:hypothetical protein
MTMAATSWADASEYVEQSIRQHKNWIQTCTDSSIAVSRTDLILYAIELGPDSDDVIRCLLSGRDASSGSQVSDSQAAVAYPSPFDGSMLGDGPQRQMFEVLIQTGTKVLIVSGVESDAGITGIRHVSGNDFIVQTGYATHDRVYLVFADSGKLAHLTNGDVEVVDGENFVFRVKGRKSCLKNSGGAFWFDALIDRHGNILDIVTPVEGNYVICMSRDQLVGESNLNLSRVVRREVCIQR